MALSIYTKLAETNKPWYENVISFEGTSNSVHEEEALYMLRLAKLTRLVGNQPDGQNTKEVIEFVANMQLDDENCIESKISVTHLVHGEKYVEFVRELFIIPKNLNAVYELNSRGEDPAGYMIGREQEYLDKIAEKPVKFEATLNKRVLKPKYRILLDIVNMSNKFFRKL